MNDNKIYKDLNDFLAKHCTKNDVNSEVSISHTHTRIGDKNLNIYAGSYIIPKEDLDTFYGLYYKEVFIKHKKEYLTEKQLDTNCPILIDLDFRYNHDVDTRQHSNEHIQDLINLVYLEELKKIFIFKENTPFPIFIFHKPNVNRLTDGSLTKDGIHIIIGIQADHILQQYLRKNVIDKIGEFWDLPLINNWDSVLDNGISKGTTNWQMFGSRKPNNEAYELTQYYEITFDPMDGEFMMEEKNIKEFDMCKNFKILSAQYSEHPIFELLPQIKAEFDNIKKTNFRVKKEQCKTKTKLKLLQNNIVDDDDNDDDIDLKNITNHQILKRAIDNIINQLNSNEYLIKEIHEYTQILPEKYYEPGSHDKNTQVAFALKNTDERLFLSWVMLRSKASDFNFNSIPDLYNRWCKHLNKKNNDKPITYKSIIYWAKQDAFNEYEKVKQNTIQYYIEETISSSTEFDLAMVLYHMFKDKFVCSSIINKTWYVFKNHRWERDLGHSLRLSISKEMFSMYQTISSDYLQQIQSYESDDDRKEKIQKKINALLALSIKLKKTNDKNNIFKEAAEIFYDKDFTKNIDSNKYLLCFTNGVMDLKNKIFRNGYPQDYITKCTGIPYIEINDSLSTEYKEYKYQIECFMKQLFVDPSLNSYVWEHLASTLIGENLNQTFNIYHGSGSNGKSILTDFMCQTLGEYKGTVPITLITEKRVGTGGTSSEIIQLKGVRYAVMQEPSKDAKINEGVMKELTGGDPIQARGLYCDSEIFTPQFSLVVCTNNLFEINSNDDGTWRRIRIINFDSKFVDLDALDGSPNQFIKDKNLKDKLPKWAPIFAGMLVKLVLQSEGIVNDCNVVMASSNKYRQGQDLIASFVSEMVVRKDKAELKKNELHEEFKKWFQECQGGRKIPKGNELYEYMDKKFGVSRGSKWKDISIAYPESENENYDE
jgi:P4 family phage/plasmid primase-like protien